MVQKIANLRRKALRFRCSPQESVSVQQNIHASVLKTHLSLRPSSAPPTRVRRTVPGRGPAFANARLPGTQAHDPIRLEGEAARVQSAEDRPSMATWINAADQVNLADQRIQTAYITILSAVTSICEEKIGRALPILVHGMINTVELILMSRGADQRLRELIWKKSIQPAG